MQNKHNAVLEINNKEMPYPKEDRTPARNNAMMINKTISIYPSIISQTTAPIADTKPIPAVTIITLTDIPLRPMTSSCNSSSNAGNENTATNSNTSRK
jgi:hypothetical protein